MKKLIEIPQSPTGGALLTKRQVALNLAISPRTVDNLMRAKAIAFVRIGRAVRIAPADVEAFKNSYRVNAA